MSQISIDKGEAAEISSILAKKHFSSNEAEICWKTGNESSNDFV